MNKSSYTDNTELGEIEEIFIGKHTNTATEVCDTLFPKNKEQCNCWVESAKRQINALISKARVNELLLAGIGGALESDEAIEYYRKRKKELEGKL